jgi:indole-3-glycerol phosphate synthase
MSILEEIFANKQTEVQKSKQRAPTIEMETRAFQSQVPQDFATALTNPNLPAPRLIAEVKYKSPSKGVFRQDFDPLSLASSYAQNGAAAISVITDKTYFGGHLNTLKQIDALDQGIPLLRKDFLFDPYQILEARANGASAVLLIVAMLSQTELFTLIRKAYETQLSPLVEVHNDEEMSRAIDAGANIIGINNRNLHDFTVDLDISLHLASRCTPDKVLVSESGIKSQSDIKLLADAGVDAILVGESLVRARDIGQKVRSLTRIAK